MSTTTNSNSDGSGNGNGNGRKVLPKAGVDPIADLLPVGGFPASERVYVAGSDGAGGELAVPARRIHLAGGEPPLDVYDTQGPLDPIRTWACPSSARRGSTPASPTAHRQPHQMHYTRRGIITPRCASSPSGRAARRVRARRGGARTPSSRPTSTTPRPSR
ncbi:MAG: hypothetical protein R2939_20415 [Kofleriaceae bacterium]